MDSSRIRVLLERRRGRTRKLRALNLLAQVKGLGSKVVLIRSLTVKVTKL